MHGAVQQTSRLSSISVHAIQALKLEFQCTNTLTGAPVQRLYFDFSSAACEGHLCTLHMKSRNPTLGSFKRMHFRNFLFPNLCVCCNVSHLIVTYCQLVFDIDAPLERNTVFFASKAYLKIISLSSFDNLRAKQTRVSSLNVREVRKCVSS